MGRIVRIWIDEDVCLAHGFCEGECPEVFEFPADGSIARIRPDAANYFDSKEKEIMDAVAICPVDCIMVERETEPKQSNQTGLIAFVRKLFSR